MEYSIKRLVVKYKKGTLADSEALRLSRWVEASQENRRAFREELSKETQTPHNPESLLFWEQFKEDFGARFTPSGKSAASRRRVFFAAVSSVAALVVVGLILFRKTEDRPLNTLAEDIPDTAQNIAWPVQRPDYVSRMVLPDGSSVTLNKGTVLTLAEDFGSGGRDVYLDGEAFFEVARDTSRLFTVHCGKEKYIVRGTSFNISSYSGYMSVVTLHTGKLEAHVKGDIITLNPGEELLVDNATENFEKRRVSDVTQSVSWVDSDRLVFSDTPLKVVAMQLSMKYNVKISVQPAIENILYTGKRTDESLEDLFRLLEYTSPVPITISGSEGIYCIEKK